MKYEPRSVANDSLVAMFSVVAALLLSDHKQLDEAGGSIDVIRHGRADYGRSRYVLTCPD